MQTELTELQTKEMRQPGQAKTLVVFHDEPRKHFPSVEIGEMACKGSELIDVRKITLVAMAVGVPVATNLERIAGSGKIPVDAHAMEAFLESPFVIPESFAGKKVFFPGEQNGKPQRGALYVVYMAENGNGWTAWFAGMSQEVPEGTFAACVEKKEIL